MFYLLKKQEKLWQRRTYCLAIYEGDSIKKETAPVSGHFGMQGPVAPARGEELKEVVSRV